MNRASETFLIRILV